MKARAKDSTRGKLFGGASTGFGFAARREGGWTSLQFARCDERFAQGGARSPDEVLLSFWRNSTVSIC